MELVLARRLRMKPSVLERIAGGDPAAVRDCIDHYGGLVWSLARRLSRTPADAEDATQEIFLHIWQHAARFDDTKGSESLFIAMLARRRLIDRLRKVSTEPPMYSSEDVLESVVWSDPGTSPETSIEAEQARLALLELRLEQRQVIELGVLDGLSHAEIAARLNMPLGTVKSCMHRGLLRVREIMNNSPKTERLGRRTYPQPRKINHRREFTNRPLSGSDICESNSKVSI